MVIENRTTVEWEARVGQHFRAVRIGNELDQESLARNASISVGALHNLESGKGSSLSTIIKVSRALDLTDWLDAIDSGASEISPMDLLRQQQRKPKTRQRVPKLAGR